FVLSSRYEGWPNVIMEALTYGCPVVSFDCPTGPREIIAPKNNLKDSLKNGVLVKNGDIQALTRAMHKLLADPKLRRRLATAGRIRASEFAIDSIAEKWLV
ncbi:MAG: glycosyltransferase, partial [Proteobacteria bacterium]|nr:glycosyltransferase [Pseudomonadota bacterium]